jgi:pyruvate dehydrogenase E2 component (dihydrolipoamide acetyltransferase)
MPRQGQSVETCIITNWLKKKGDVVKTGDILFSYETDKASFDAEAPEGGILLDIFFNDGDEVPVLTNVAVIGAAGEPADGFRPGQAITVPDTNVTNDKTAARPERSPSSSRPHTHTHTHTHNQLRISPRARCMAAKLGVNTENMTGSGPNGRILARDIENASVAAPATVFSGPEYNDRKLSNVRKLIARAMFESISNSAQLTHHMSADARKILSLRQQVKANMEKGGPNITLNDMICYAVIRALEKYPDINSHFLGESIRTFKSIHLGLAVDTSRGLMVPAVRDAGQLSLKGLSSRLYEVAEQCRKGNINPELLAGTASTFTVSNLGNYGVEMFTPIINLPQVAILGINTIIHRPADLGDGVFGFIPVIGISLTYDHRAIDGGPATLFLKEVRNQIENFNENVEALKR